MWGAARIVLPRLGACARVSPRAPRGRVRSRRARLTGGGRPRGALRPGAQRAASPRASACAVGRPGRGPHRGRLGQHALPRVHADRVQGRPRHARTLQDHHGTALLVQPGAPGSPCSRGRAPVASLGRPVAGVTAPAGDPPCVAWEGPHSPHRAGGAPASPRLRSGEGEAWQARQGSGSGGVMPTRALMGSPEQGAASGTHRCHRRVPCPQVGLPASA